MGVVRSARVDRAVAGPVGRVDAGDEVSYLFIVVNAGNVTLTGVSVTAPDGTTAVCSPARLAPRATATCSKVVVLTQGQVDDGALGAATVTASPPRGMEALNVSVVETTILARSPAVSYSFTVARMGEATLTMDLTRFGGGWLFPFMLLPHVVHAP